MSHMSANLILRKQHTQCVMICDDLDVLSPRYTLTPFLSIGSAYFSHYYLEHFKAFLERLRDISCMNFVKQN